MNKCERCKLNEKKIILQRESKTIHLCSNCYNELMAEELKVELEQLIDTFSIKDYQGIIRTFHVEQRIYPIGIYLEASENIEFGYKFAVHGEIDCDQQDLLNKLIRKTRGGIGKQQVETRAFPSGQEYIAMIHDQISGRIEYDETSEGTPLVIIDGRPFTWEEVGKMLMSYEGFQMQVKMVDITDDVE